MGFWELTSCFLPQGRKKKMGQYCRWAREQIHPSQPQEALVCRERKGSLRCYEARRAASLSPSHTHTQIFLWSLNSQTSSHLSSPATVALSPAPSYFISGFFLLISPHRGAGEEGCLMILIQMHAFPCGYISDIFLHFLVRLRGGLCSLKVVSAEYIYIVDIFPLF